MEKVVYSIGEVADILGESVSLVRYWSNQFPELIKPRRNAKENRLYSKEDIEALKEIHFLVKDKGLTLEGARKRIKDEHSSVDKTVKAIERLKEIRAQLLEIKTTI